MKESACVHLRARGFFPGLCQCLAAIHSSGFSAALVSGLGRAAVVSRSLRWLGLLIGPPVAWYGPVKSLGVLVRRHTTRLLATRNIVSLLVGLTSIRG